MSRGSKVFRPTDLPESNSSGYPAPFRDGQRKRWNRRLGDHGGLKNYGVNFIRVEPGGQSSARHSHTKQDGRAITKSPQSARQYIISTKSCNSILETSH
jgi:hypothetical protein